jgi:hypothetical protein
MESIISGPWQISLNDGDDVPAATMAELKEHIANAERLEGGTLAVYADGGPRPWWHRLFGLQRRFVLCYFMLEWCGDYASLMFLDENWSEYRAIDEAHPVNPSEEIRVKIAHGEVIPHPVNECMKKERAFAAVRAFLDSGLRPEWLKYRFVG